MKEHADPTPREQLAPGLYPVATPIGNLRDLSARAAGVLQSADLIACEDTRVTGKLLRHYGIRTSAIPYHDHNAAKARPELIARLKSGARIALVSDAGTPLISDPGYKLVREAQEAGIAVHPIPGASSVMAALMLAGLPTDRFLFLGFLPTGEEKCREFLTPYLHVPATLVMFESAKRLRATLSFLAPLMDGREAAVARELTKMYEECIRAPIAELAALFAQRPEPKGEIVLLVGPPPERKAGDEEINAALRDALLRLPVKEAVAEVAYRTGAARNRVYDLALAIKKESRDGEKE